MTTRSSQKTLEAKRIAALNDFQILDTLEEPLYDAFTQAAVDLLGCSMSAISLIDEHRQWFKSHQGLAIRETSREHAFCTHIVASGQPMEVPDARIDDRFRNNPLVTGAPHIRFYAGVPLTTPQGHTIGTLCAFDARPLTMTPTQRSALAVLASAVMATLESRRHFVALFDAAHIDLFTIDSTTETLVFASRGACTRLGYTLRELVGMPIYDVMPALSDRAFKSAIQHIRSGKTITHEAELRRRDGSTYPVELRLILTQEQGQERVVAIAIDISKQESARHELDVLLRAIDVAGDVILVYRVTDDGDLRLAYLNDAYTQRTGYTRGEAIDASLKFFRQDMPDDEGMRAVRTAITAETSIVTELISYRKDGGAYWNKVSFYPIRDGSARVTHWVSTERDITAEVKRTALLEEEHDRLLALSRAARSLFTVLETPKLIPTLRKLLHDLLGVSTIVLAVFDDGSQVEVSEIGRIGAAAHEPEPLVAQAVSQRERAVSSKHDRVVAYAGHFGEAEYVLDLRQKTQQLRVVDLFVIDIVCEYFAVAARNAILYRALNVRRSEVIELSQTKSDLIAMLAHDFRGPLTSIVGFADLLGELGNLSGEQQEFIDTIKRSAMQLSELATDTLTLSLLERSEVTLALRDVRLESLLRIIITQYADRRQVHLTRSGDDEIVGDYERLRQVFSNLIDNAIKYSPDGSVPDVSVDGTGASVIVRVSDHGIGIPTEETARVFHRFSRASNARKLHISGTGFGLFLAKQIVALHGGTIALDSREGEGSVFTVTLPRRVLQSSTPKAIVVLDEEHDHAFIGDGLRESGYRVMNVATLEDLLATTDAQSVDAIVVSVPDVVLSNERAAALRTFSRTCGAPIIAISDQAVPLLGAVATIVRPVLVRDVITALRRCLEP